MKKNPDPKLITTKAWEYVNALEKIHPHFKSLCKDMKQKLTEWRTWILSKEPQLTPLPSPYEKTLSYFQKLLLLKAFRDQKILLSVIQFIDQLLGKEFSQPKPPDLEDVYKESNARTPIVFVLSAGADPTNLIMRFVKKMKQDEEKPIISISLGEGQGGYAKQAIDLYADNEKGGGWVLLQNCHLCKSWMESLAKIVSDITESKVQTHEDFRLFLTSMPCSYFPVSILQNGLKITNEPPQGIKSNLSINLKIISPEKFEECKKLKEFKRLTFSLCFFHAILQERRKFGPLGWNKFYEFNESDLETGITVLRNLLDAHEDIPWDALRFVVGEITWGGRVTDDQDRRCLMSILNGFIHENIVNTDNYKFAASEDYIIPETPLLNEIFDYVENMPLRDDPEIFGMNENANIACQKQDSDFLLKTVLSLQPATRSSSGSEKGPDQIVSESCDKIKKQMPAKMKEGEINKVLFLKIRGNVNSLTTFILQEMERFNKLIGVMEISLTNLKKALKGEVIMSEDLDQMYKSMLINKVPLLWEEHAYPSLMSLGNWVLDLKNRVDFVRAWLKEGAPQAYWLAAFFFPQGFLTAVLQNYSRKFSIAIDQLSFSFELQKFFQNKDISTMEEDAVLIFGLFLEAGKIDLEELVVVDALPGEAYSDSPMILFIPTANYEPEEEDYSCPVYKTHERAGALSTTGHSTNFIISIDCPTTAAPEYWILKGTAFLCQKAE